MFLFCFFKAKAGIRDGHVTGVQTFALPIWAGRAERAERAGWAGWAGRGGAVPRRTLRLSPTDAVAGAMVAAPQRSKTGTDSRSPPVKDRRGQHARPTTPAGRLLPATGSHPADRRDRKSTRLNSSHVAIS